MTDSRASCGNLLPTSLIPPEPLRPKNPASRLGTVQAPKGSVEPCPCTGSSALRYLHCSTRWRCIALRCSASRCMPASTGTSQLKTWRSCCKQASKLVPARTCRPAHGDRYSESVSPSGNPDRQGHGTTSLGFRRPRPGQPRHADRAPFPLRCLGGSSCPPRARSGGLSRTFTVTRGQPARPSDLGSCR